MSRHWWANAVYIGIFVAVVVVAGIRHDLRRRPIVLPVPDVSGLSYPQAVTSLGRDICDCHAAVVDYSNAGTDPRLVRAQFVKMRALCEKGLSLVAPPQYGHIDAYLRRAFADLSDTSSEALELLDSSDGNLQRWDPKLFIELGKAARESQDVEQVRAAAAQTMAVWKSTPSGTLRVPSTER